MNSQERFSEQQNNNGRLNRPFNAADLRDCAQVCKELFGPRGPLPSFFGEALQWHYYPRAYGRYTGITDEVGHILYRLAEYLPQEKRE